MSSGVGQYRGPVIPGVREQPDDVLRALANGASSTSLASTSTSVSEDRRPGGTLSIVSGFDAIANSKIGSRVRHYLIDQEPEALAKLRSAHARWRQLEKELWLEAQPSAIGLAMQETPLAPAFGYKGDGREHGLFVFQSRNDPNNLEYAIRAATTSRNAIEGSVPYPEGGADKWKWIALFHTHPFAWSGSGSLGYPRGPSPADWKTADNYKDVLFYIHSLGSVEDSHRDEWHYYGSWTGFE